MDTRTRQRDTRCLFLSVRLSLVTQIFREQANFHGGAPQFSFFLLNLARSANKPLIARSITKPVKRDNNASASRTAQELLTVSGHVRLLLVRQGYSVTCEVTAIGRKNLTVHKGILRRKERPDVKTRHKPT